MRRLRTTVVLGAMLGVLGCRPEGAPADGSTSSSSATGTGTGTGTSESETGIRCDDPMFTACDGECVELRWNNDHCGACGVSCDPHGSKGSCAEGVCTPKLFCRLPEEGYKTCAEVCQSHDTICAEPRPDNPRWAAHSYGLYFDDGGADLCLAGGSANESVDAECDDPIDWSRTGGFNDEPAVGAACFCLQQ